MASAISVSPATTPVDGLTATVSVDLVQELLQSLSRLCTEAVLDQCLQQAGIVKDFIAKPGARVTHDQLVGLYQHSARATGDEMMGLWSRPIRTGSLKYIMRAVMGAPSIQVALYRFMQFWNLLLDDYRLEFTHSEQVLQMALIPRTRAQSLNRFGHALLLKLTHGIVSWLVGREVPVTSVGFAFARPHFAADYPVLFPAPVAFACAHSHIVFPAELGKLRSSRNAAQVQAFLTRAPRDWIFTASHAHAMPLRVRELLSTDLGRGLDDVSARLHMSPRTLIRKLQAEGQSFQGIKDELRRDLALLYLARNAVSLTAIAEALGFSSTAVFQRAFKHWMGMTPGAYRAAQQTIGRCE